MRRPSQRAGTSWWTGLRRKLPIESIVGCSLHAETQIEAPIRGLSIGSSPAKPFRSIRRRACVVRNALDGQAKIGADPMSAPEPPML
jgi:hypothetical protein